MVCFLQEYPHNVKITIKDSFIQQLFSIFPSLSTLLIKVFPFTQIKIPIHNYFYLCIAKSQILLLPYDILQYNSPFSIKFLVIAFYSSFHQSLKLEPTLPTPISL